MKFYQVLAPLYTRHLDRFQKEYFSVDWEVLGTADDMQEAKKLHPCPVLEKRV